jgi:hypothetical protein
LTAASRHSRRKADDLHQAAAGPDAVEIGVAEIAAGIDESAQGGTGRDDGRAGDGQGIGKRAARIQPNPLRPQTYPFLAN